MRLALAMRLELRTEQSLVDARPCWAPAAGPWPCWNHWTTVMDLTVRTAMTTGRAKKDSENPPNPKLYAVGPWPRSGCSAMVMMLALRTAMTTGRAKKDSKSLPNPKLHAVDLLIRWAAVMKPMARPAGQTKKDSESLPNPKLHAAGPWARWATAMKPAARTARTPGRTKKGWREGSRR